jgi:hypothetical protein
MLHEIVDFFSKIKYNSNGQYQHNTKEEGTKELLDNVSID